MGWDGDKATLLWVGLCCGPHSRHTAVDTPSLKEPLQGVSKAWKSLMVPPRESQIPH